MNFACYLLLIMIWVTPAADDLQTIALVDGQELAGRVLTISEGNVSFEHAGEVHKYPIESVQRIGFSGLLAADMGPVETRLVDGSLLRLHNLS
ncbi:MAG: hypothetical protein ACR2NP_22555, partial [Pirellulaceae bacterium]